MIKEDIDKYINQTIWAYRICFADVLNATSRLIYPTTMFVRGARSNDAPSAYRNEIHLVGIKNGKILKSKLVHINYTVSCFLTEDKCKKQFHLDVEKLIQDLSIHIMDVNKKLNIKLQILQRLYDNI